MSQKRNGFTLIELLLVIGILGILAAIGLSTFSGAIIKGKDGRRKSDLSQIAKALELYKNDFGEYPDDDSDGGMVGCQEDSGVTLITCPTVSGAFKRKKNSQVVKYLDILPEEVDNDRRYYYQRTGSGADLGFSLYSALENTNDRDVKKDAGGDPDPDGWSVNCGDPSGSPVCNYKLTNTGVMTQ